MDLGLSLHRASGTRTWGGDPQSQESPSQRLIPEQNGWGHRVGKGLLWDFTDPAKSPVKHLERSLVLTGHEELDVLPSLHPIPPNPSCPSPSLAPPSLGATRPSAEELPKVRLALPEVPPPTAQLLAGAPPHRNPEGKVTAITWAPQTDLPRSRLWLKNPSGHSIPKSRVNPRPYGP